MNIEYVGNEVIFSGVCPDKLHVKDYLNDSIDTITFKDFDTSEVVDMSHMFDGCKHISTILGLDTFNTSNVKNMTCMFAECEAVSKCIDHLNNWNVRNVKTMDVMFFFISSLRSVDLSKWETPSLEKCNSMFCLCFDLSYLRLDNFGCSKYLKDVSDMFNGCELKTLVMPKIHITEFTDTVPLLDIEGFDDYEIPDEYMCGIIQQKYTEFLLSKCVDC